VCGAWYKESVISRNENIAQGQNTICRDGEIQSTAVNMSQCAIIILTHEPEWHKTLSVSYNKASSVEVHNDWKWNDFACGRQSGEENIHQYRLQPIDFLKFECFIVVFIHFSPVPVIMICLNRKKEVAMIMDLIFRGEVAF